MKKQVRKTEYGGPNPCLLAALLVLLAAPAPALDPIVILEPGDVPEGFTNAFGVSSAIRGDYIAVGAPRDPWTNGDATGAVYVFRRIGPNWVEQEKLIGSQPVWQAQLGWSVDMDGDVIVAGAPAFESNSCDVRREGSVYVFRRFNGGTADPGDDTWIEEGKLFAPLSQHGVGLGFSVAISGEVIVAGSDCGERAEVFHYVEGSWEHEATLTRADVQTYQAFGSSVDVDGNRIVVGAHGYNERRGAAYIFRFFDGQWIPEMQLALVDGQLKDDFGLSVSISDNHVAVGAPNEDNAGVDSSSGASYMYRRGIGNVWKSPQELAPSDVRSLAQFGSMVVCEGDLSLIAKRGTRWGYLFHNEYGNWVECQVLVGSGQPLGLSMNGNYAMISDRLYVIRNRNDLSNFADFQNCFSSSEDECQPLGGQLNLVDFGEFIATFGGP